MILDKSQDGRPPLRRILTLENTFDSTVGSSREAQDRPTSRQILSAKTNAYARSSETLPLSRVQSSRLEYLRQHRVSSTASLPSPAIDIPLAESVVSNSDDELELENDCRNPSPHSEPVANHIEPELCSMQAIQSATTDPSLTSPTHSLHRTPAERSITPHYDGKDPKSTSQNSRRSSDIHTSQTTSAVILQQTSPLSKSSKSERKASAKAIAKNLRPVIDDRIEPLPISKEKEAILACTRPTHLPPKSRKEEKKHIKEYEKLMYGSLESEKKLQKRNSKLVTQKAKHLTNSADTWTNHILPHFATAVKDPRTKHLWWSGLPNRVRGNIWSICIGNTLSVDETTFKIALRKSQETEANLKRWSSSDSDADEATSQLLTLESYNLLNASVRHTFPDLKIFQSGGPLHESLIDVLKAYLYYRQDVMVSYIEGVNYIAGLLLLYLPASQTFITMVNVLNRALPLALYTRDEPVLGRFVAVFLSRLGQRLPSLNRHLHEVLHLSPLTYLEPMLISFLARQAPIDISSRIFDIYAFEGDAFLLRAVIGVFIALEHALYGTAEEVLTVLSGNDREDTWAKNLREDDFIKLCRAAY